MKKLFFYIFCVLLLTHLQAKEVDLSTSKGIDQEVIELLAPTPAQTDVERSVSIKAKFNVMLDPKHIKKNDIWLKRIEPDMRHIDASIHYDQTSQTITLQPKELLDEGVYEVTYQSIKTIKSQKGQQIKEIKYRFYVPEMIDGHMLPPKPDMQVNNSTIAGIDANNNGVRDDIEWWIYTKMDVLKYSKAERLIAMEWGKAIQIILKNPQSAESIYERVHMPLYCFYYYKFTYLYRYPVDYAIFNHDFRDIAFNTKERQKAYNEYDSLLSGKIFPMGRIHPDQCNFNIDAVIQEAKQ
ncbi:MAG: hypothetical protein U9Q90_06540 [Campylobacterota bacterium]|nr:hypothetical protein [Campylobacterota bacterium]